MTWRRRVARGKCANARLINIISLYQHNALFGSHLFACLFCVMASWQLSAGSGVRAYRRDAGYLEPYGEHLGIVSLRTARRAVFCASRRAARIWHAAI